jgi:hypothetical protein
MADKIDKQGAWIDFAHDAMDKYVPPEEVDSNDGLVDDMVEIATKVRRLDARRDRGAVREPWGA